MAPARTVIPSVLRRFLKIFSFRRARTFCVAPGLAGPCKDAGTVETEYQFFRHLYGPKLTVRRPLRQVTRMTDQYLSDNGPITTADHMGFAQVTPAIPDQPKLGYRPHSCDVTHSPVVSRPTLQLVT
jgi:hypothetical protein